jgi:hypothetical protein
MSELPPSMCADRPPFEVFIEGAGVMQRMYEISYASFVFEIYVRHSKHRDSKYNGKRVLLYKDGAIIREHTPQLLSELASYLAPRQGEALAAC